MAGERTLPGLGLKAYWNLGSAFKTDMDTNLLRLSVATQLTVISRIAALPGSPTDGDMYLLTATGNVDKIAVRDNGAWVYLTPSTGWRVYVGDTNRIWAYDGGWYEFAAANIGLTSPLAGGFTATTVQGGLEGLLDHINFLDTHLRLLAAGLTPPYVVPTYTPP